MICGACNERMLDAVEDFLKADGILVIDAVVLKCPTCACTVHVTTRSDEYHELVERARERHAGPLQAVLVSVGPSKMRWVVGPRVKAEERN